MTKSLQKFQKKIIKKKIITFSKKIPQKKNFDLVIVATNSLERLKVIREIFNLNKVKYLILEKFLFNFSNDYSSLKRILKNKSTKTMTNVWGKVIFEPISKKINRNSVNKIEIDCKEEILTNLIHYYDFINSVIKKKFQLKLNAVRFIKSKRKKYSEMIGSLTAKKKNYLPIISIKLKKNMNYFHILKIICNERNIEIKINRSGNCLYYENKKMFKKLKFPYAYLNTEKFFLRDYRAKKKKYFSNLTTTMNLSKQILELIKRASNKRIYIT